MERWLPGAIFLKNGSKVRHRRAGGLGSSAAFYPAAASVGHIGIADPDVVDISNLNRQILHTSCYLGKLKTEFAASTLNRFNPGTVVIAHPIKLVSRELLNALIPGLTPCFQCLYPDVRTLSKGKLLMGRLLFADLLEMHFDVMKTSRNKDCLACRHLADHQEAINYL